MTICCHADDVDDGDSDDNDADGVMILVFGVATAKITDLIFAV